MIGVSKISPRLAAAAQLSGGTQAQSEQPVGNSNKRRSPAQAAIALGKISQARCPADSLTRVPLGEHNSTCRSVPIDQRTSVGQSAGVNLGIIVPQNMATYSQNISFRSTVDSPNRVRDRARVELIYRLPEFGDASRQFFAPNGELIARGYNRMVYGDHGPYIEFTTDQIDFTVLNQDEARVTKLPERRFDLWYSADGYVKVYDQLRDVSDRPNPPKGKHACNNNRPGGYADYQPGFLYVDPECFELDDDGTDSVTENAALSLSTTRDDGAVSEQSDASLLDIIERMQPGYMNFFGA